MKIFRNLDKKSLETANKSGTVQWFVDQGSLSVDGTPVIGEPIRVLNQQFVDHSSPAASM